MEAVGISSLQSGPVEAMKYTVANLNDVKIIQNGVDILPKRQWHGRRNCGRSA